jgi:hypothetical protein
MWTSILHSPPWRRLLWNNCQGRVRRWWWRRWWHGRGTATADKGGSNKDKSKSNSGEIGEVVAQRWWQCTLFSLFVYFYFSGQAHKMVTQFFCLLDT